MGILKSILPTGWICLLLMGSNITTAYLVKKYYTQVKTNKIRCQAKLDDLKANLETCNKTISVLNDLYIQDTNITTNTQKRINRVNSYKGDYIYFDSIFK